MKQELQIALSPIAYPRVACEMDVRGRRIASAPASPRSVAECVSGVLTRNGAVLVEKRRADDEADPGLTFLPGGHVEPGESLDQALKREMREELGIRVEKTTLLLVRLYTASNGERQRIHYFHIIAWKGRIRSREAETVYWESEFQNLSDAVERRIVRTLLGQSSRRFTIGSVRSVRRFGSSSVFGFSFFC